MAVELERLVIAEAPLVRIRYKHLSDALNDFRWRRDPQIATYDAARPFTVSFSDFLLQYERELRFPDPTRRMYALISAGGEHLGNVMYYNATPYGDAAEFGISIGVEAERGKGIGSQATIAFLRYLWETHAFRRIYLHTLEWNERARRCFSSAGFEIVGRVIRNGQGFLQMEARREWWLLWDMEGRFAWERDGVREGI